MVDDEMIQLALRTRAKQLSLVTTGSVTLAATATGYSRSSGSFLTDGFVVGMEVTPSGFASNVVGTITAVAALTLTINGGRTVESAGAGRSLAVGLPADVAWENIPFSATTGKPYIGEQYAPGPQSQITVGPLGTIRMSGLYVLDVYVPANTGISADGKYSKGLKNLFPPRYAITLSNGDVLRVNHNPAPYRGQRRQPVPGYSWIPVTIPFWLLTQNSI